MPVVGRKVDPTDPRKLLRGEHKLVTLVPLRKGRVVGTYAGILLESDPSAYTDDQSVAKLVQSVQSVDSMWSFDSQKHFNISGEEWRYKCEQYAVDVEVNGPFLTGDGKLPLNEDGQWRLTLTAWCYGNRTALMNDPHNIVVIDDVTGTEVCLVDAERSQDDYTTAPVKDEPNVVLCNIDVFGFPFLFVIASREVEVEEEIMFEYGYEYWVGLHTYRKVMQAAQ